MLISASGLPHLGVEKRHLGEAVPGHRGKGGGQISGLAAGGVSGGGHHPHILAVRVLDEDEAGARLPDQSYVWGPGEGARAVCVLARIVVPRRVHDWDASLGQAREFLQQKALGLERESLPVE